MKKVNFLVQTLISSLDSFLSETKYASSEISIDVKKKSLTFKYIDDDSVNSLIDCVSSYFSVISISITETHTPFYDAKPEESINLDNVKDEYLNELSAKLLKTALWAVYHRGVNPKKIASHFYTCSNEISLRSTNIKLVDFKVGDLVTCYYGAHFPGEINGHNVIGIVCDILSKDMVFIVPVTKIYNSDIKSRSYLQFSVPEDAKYWENSYEGSYEGGIALLDKGKYIHVKRIVKKSGRTSYHLFAQILQNLATTTFDFTSCLKNLDETNWDFKL